MLIHSLFHINNRKLDKWYPKFIANGKIVRDAYQTLPHFSHKPLEFVVKHGENQIFYIHRHDCALSHSDI